MLSPLPLPPSPHCHHLCCRRIPCHRQSRNDHIHSCLHHLQHCCWRHCHSRHCSQHCHHHHSLCCRHLPRHLPHRRHHRSHNRRLAAAAAAYNTATDAIATTLAAAATAAAAAAAATTTAAADSLAATTEAASAACCYPRLRFCCRHPLPWPSLWHCCCYVVLSLVFFTKSRNSFCWRTKYIFRCWDIFESTMSRCFL